MRFPQISRPYYKTHEIDCFRGSKCQAFKKPFGELIETGGPEYSNAFNYIKLSATCRITPGKRPLRPWPYVPADRDITVNMETFSTDLSSMP